MALSKTLFNPGFSPAAAKELNRRGSMPDSWKYKKYAYINLKLTGKSASTICVEDDGLVIGDSNVSSMYTNEGGVRKPKIVLQSVNVVNQGNNGSYTDAYLYEIDASFKVYNKNTMDRVEKGFFRLGAEMQISFGWRGYTSAVNKGTILASIYNFGFSMEADGSYVCNVKAMSAAGLFAQETAGGETTVESLGLPEGIAPEETTFSNLMESFKLMAKAAFGIKDGEKTPKKDLKDNQVRYRSYKDYQFAILELEKPAVGMWDSFVKGIGFGDDATVLYTSLGSIFDYLNKTTKNAGGLFWINYNPATQSESKLGPPELTDIGSANPFRTVLPVGKAGVYAKAGGTQKINFYSTKSPKLSSTYNKSLIGMILLNIDTVAEVYSGLQGEAPGAKGVKSPPKTAEFLSKLFSIIEEDTGGVVRLHIRPKSVDVDAHNFVPEPSKRQFMEVYNGAMIPVKGVKNPTPYTFKVLGQASITRNVSLASDFDTDLLIKASQKSIKEGSSNMAGLSLLYSNCGIADVITPDENTIVKMQHIEDRKADIGENGWSAEKSSTLTSLIQKYMMQNAHNIPSGAYAEIPMMLKLGVTIDGITGVKYMSPIKIDRMPSIYNNSNIDFAITSIEHSFDGQGDWTTTYETVMRIK